MRETRAGELGDFHPRSVDAQMEPHPCASYHARTVPAPKP